MTFWNGSEWLPETPTDPTRTAPPRKRRFRDWVATLIMIAALGAYVLPMVTTTASGASLTLTPDHGVVGSRVSRDRPGLRAQDQG